jgi:hypothetical protein
MISRDFCIGLALAALCSLCAAGPAPAQDEQEEMMPIEIFGRILSENEPIPGAQVRLSFTKLVSDESGLAMIQRDEINVRSDENGDYSISLRVDRDWLEVDGAEFVLSMVRLDWNRYRSPRDKILTDLILMGLEQGESRFEANWILEGLPNWSELKLEINRYGENTEKGRLLRRFGMPDKIDEFRRDGVSGSIWYYYRLVPLNPLERPENEGLAIRFIGDKEEKRFRLATRRSRSGTSR